MVVCVPCVCYQEKRDSKQRVRCRLSNAPMRYVSRPKQKRINATFRYSLEISDMRKTPHTCSPPTIKLYLIGNFFGLLILIKRNS